MDFKKTQQRIKDERNRTRPPTVVGAAAVSDDVAPKFNRSSPKADEFTAAESVAIDVGATDVDTTDVGATDAGTRGSQVHGLVQQTHHPKRGPSPLRVDPLQEFLACYDVGADVAEDAAMEPLRVEHRYLSFDLAGEHYAASIMEIREILKLVRLTEVPRAPKEILGVLSKRGVVMPVVDLASLLSLRAADHSVGQENRVLVIGEGDRTVGLRVDRVRHVVRLHAHDIEALPPSLKQHHVPLLIGLGRVPSEATDRRDVVILLDLAAVLVTLTELLCSPGRSTDAGTDRQRPGARA